MGIISKTIARHYKVTISSVLAFFIPLVIYILTLQPKVISGETAWYALYIPQMKVLPPTGFPIYSLLSKAFTLIPFGDIAYKLNLFSAIFGAFTVLILFFAIYTLVKDEIISIVCSLTFAFIFPFWSIANRIEIDTINLCFILLAVYSALRYSENINKKNLYFFFFSFGLSLTNNQINYYVMPVFLLYVIFINPQIFKNKKVIFLSILFFIIPLLSYSYIFIRSFNDYISANNFISFIYYIFGRLPNGDIYTGSLQYTINREVFKIFSDYIKLFYKNFGLFFSIISFGGFIYLIKKNLKFAIFSFLAIAVNFYIIIQYLYGSVLSYLLPVYSILFIYIAFFFLLIKDFTLILLQKTIKYKNNQTKKVTYNNIIVTTLLLLLLLQPLILAFTNFNSSNNSAIDETYIAWNNVFNKIENNSYLFVQSRSSNIGAYINTFEQKNKGIKFILDEDEEYSFEYIGKIFNEGKKVYIAGNEKNMDNVFNLENTNLNFFIERFNESLSIKKITGEKIKPQISHIIKEVPKNIGDQFSIEFIISNNSSKKIKIDSLELKLPKNIEIGKIDSKGYFKQDPGFAQAKYMWVSDSYFVEGNSEINLILNLNITSSEESIIKFRITTQGIFIEYADIIIDFLNN